MLTVKLQETKTALIDGDSLAFKTGHCLTGEEVQEQLKQHVLNILLGSGARHYIGFIGKGKETFKHKLMGSYKSHRIGKPLPENVGLSKRVLRDNLGFYELTDMEAEDGVGVCLAHKLYKGTPVICHIDSDLNQLSGHHYNYDKKTTYHVTEEEARYNYWKMVVLGSHKDNIKGLYRFREKDLTLETGDSFMTLAKKSYLMYKSHMGKQLETVKNYMEFEPEGVIDAYFKLQSRMQKIKTYGRRNEHYDYTAKPFGYYREEADGGSDPPFELV